MSRIKDRLEQETHSKTVPRRALTALGRTTTLALLCIALMFLFLFLLFCVNVKRIVSRALLQN